MLIKPDERQKRALRLLRAPDMAPVVELLAAENGVILSHLINNPDPTTLHRMQGRAQLIHDLLSLIQAED